MGSERSAEIAPDGVFQPDAILHEQWIVQPIALVQFRHQLGLLGALGAQHGGGESARHHPHRHEDDK